MKWQFRETQGAIYGHAAACAMGLSPHIGGGKESFPFCREQGYVWQRKYGEKVDFARSQEFIERHEMTGSDFFHRLKSRWSLENWQVAFQASRMIFCLIHDNFLVDCKGFEVTRSSSHTA